MNELNNALRECLANTFMMYFRAHTFHWNVEGIHFVELHEYFGDLYEELHSAVDPLAENIRFIDSYAPQNMNQIYMDCTLSMLDSTTVGADYVQMLKQLIDDNAVLMNSLNKAFTIAESNNVQGIADFIASRLEAHSKHMWMLKSLSK